MCVVKGLAVLCSLQFTRGQVSRVNYVCTNCVVRSCKLRECFTIHTNVMKKFVYSETTWLSYVIMYVKVKNIKLECGMRINVFTLQY